MKILVSCPRGRTFESFFTCENIKLAESLGEVVWNPYDRNMSVEEAAELISGCQAYVSVWGAPRLEQPMLEAAPELRLLTHLCGTPFPFMSQEAWRAGIRVISGQSYFAASTAEGTLAYILAALRNIPEYSGRLKYKKEWRHSWDSNRGLFGKRVGIVNYNEVAEQFVVLIKAFNVELLVYDARTLSEQEIRRFRIRQTTLDSVISRSDIIVVNTPQWETGDRMINSDLLATIRQGALLVNISRGGTVDQKALVMSLMTGRYYAVLDKYEKEPLDYDDPLFYLPNVILMPHMAGPTNDLRSLVARDLLRESASFIDRGGKLRHEIRYGDMKKFGYVT